MISPTANSNYNSEKTPPDSAVLFVAINKAIFNPTSPQNFPGEKTLRMPKQEANDLAVSLNRKILEKPRTAVDHWNVVHYGKSGFYVGVVQVTQRWFPEDEYETPPTEYADLTNTEARRVVNEHNSRKLQSFQIQSRWAIHIKPLTRPAIEYGPTVCTRELDRSELNELEQEISDTLHKNLRGYSSTKTVHIEEGGRSLGTFVQFPEGWSRINIQSVPTHEVASRLRDQAAQLLQAAAELTGEEEPQLEIAVPFYEVVVDNSDYVSLMLNNCRSEEEALQRGAEFLTRMRHSEYERKSLSADAA